MGQLTGQDICRHVAAGEYGAVMSKWTLNFVDAKLELAYRQKEGSFKGDRDYGCVILQLLHSVGEFWLVWQRLPKSHRCGMWSALSAPGSPSASQCLKWHIFVSACCIAMLVGQIFFLERYRRHRLLFLSVFMAVIWSCESVRCYCNDDNLNFMISKVVYPSIIVAFAYNVPWSIHVRARVLGFVLQVLGIAARGNCYETRFFTFVLLVAHGVGSMLAYALDRRSRVDYLKSMPEFFLKAILRDPTRYSGVQEEQQKALNMCAEKFWKVLCPRLPPGLNNSNEFVSRSLRTPRTNSQARAEDMGRFGYGGGTVRFGNGEGGRGRGMCCFNRRAASGLAGGFFGVSDLSTGDNGGADHLKEVYEDSQKGHRISPSINSSGSAAG